MRIGLFTDTFPPDINGVANSTYILFQELKKHGHDVFVIAPRKGAGSAQWNPDHTILRLAGIRLPKLYGYVATTPLHLNALTIIGDLHLDVIHAQTEFGVGMFARMCAHQYGIPTVITYHTTYEDYTHYANVFNSAAFDEKARQAVAYLTKIYANASVEVIAPSEKTKEMLERYHVRTNIHVVPTGLDLARFSALRFDPEKRRQIREETRVKEDERLVIYVGRIAEEKALDLVVRGFAKAKQANLKVKLLVVGGGPDREKLIRLAEEKGAADSICFAGPRPAEQIPDYYRAADAFVSASLTETQGMTFIEALASGLPVLARHDEVLDALVLEGKTGWYFADEETLVAKLRLLMQADQEAMRLTCRKQVEPFSADVFYERVLHVYEEAVRNYAAFVKITDVKIKDDLVCLQFSDLTNKKEKNTLCMTLDDYFTAGLRKGGKINAASLELFRKKENIALMYQRSIRKLSIKDRTEQEMRQWLRQESACTEADIDHILTRLKEKGYIDDERYCRDFVNRMKLALFGPERIRRDLLQKGVSPLAIDQFLNPQENAVQDDALRYAEKAAASMHGLSVRMKKQKLKQKLTVRGYSSAVIDRIMQEFVPEDDEAAQLDILRTCALKARRRYARKYTSTQLRNMVYRYCAAQGFNSEDIYVILDEMEWDDE